MMSDQRPTYGMMMCGGRTRRSGWTPRRNNAWAASWDEKARKGVGDRAIGMEEIRNDRGSGRPVLGDEGASKAHAEEHGVDEGVGAGVGPSGGGMSHQWRAGSEGKGLIHVGMGRCGSSFRLLLYPPFKNNKN